MPSHHLKDPSSTFSSPAPSFPTRDQSINEFELQAWASSLSPGSTTSLLSLPPPYPPPPSPFNPTLHLQIQTPGKPWLSLPLPPKPDPIPIFSVNPEDGTRPSSPRYISIRPERGSGSSHLISRDDKVLSTTTYRFGPGKPPVICLFDGVGDEHEPEPWDTFPVVSTSLLTRTQTLKHTRLGTFVWRYASRSERRALDPRANNIIVLERVTHFAVAGGRNEEVCRTVGLFVRNEEVRTPGSKASSAGNGGRLMLDLGLWDGDETDREMVVVLAVTSVLVMLKKEVDRRRAAQIVIMVSVAGGGGS